jgi:hypothetical protein
VRDHEATAGPEEGNDVVAHFACMRMARQVLIGERDELELLAAVDGVDSVSGGEALARFHFHEDERSSASDDEIDLAASQADVARDDAVAAQSIEPRRAAFAALSELSRRDAHAAEDPSVASNPLKFYGWWMVSADICVICG